MRLYSYIVRYDSGFAPNPFYNFCTLATCKPKIRKPALVDDWVIGTGSGNKKVGRSGYLVYAMRITDVITFQDYWQDQRFQRKKPNLRGSRKQSCGDNIYSLNPATQVWNQLDSYHSNNDGSPNLSHIQRDTGINRILLSNDFVYFGGCGPRIPDAFRNYGGEDICKSRQGHKVIRDTQLIRDFVGWIASLNVKGYVSPPFEWLTS